METGIDAGLADVESKRLPMNTLGGVHQAPNTAVKTPPFIVESHTSFQS